MDRFEPPEPDDGDARDDAAADWGDAEYDRRRDELAEIEMPTPVDSDLAVAFRLIVNLSGSVSDIVDLIAALRERVEKLEFDALCAEGKTIGDGVKANR